VHQAVSGNKVTISEKSTCDIDLANCIAQSVAVSDTNKNILSQLVTPRISFLFDLDPTQSGN
jgi:hypothetical protein